MGCLDESAIDRLLAGDIDRCLRDAFEHHIADCDGCRELVGAAAKLHAGEEEPATAEREAMTRAGRYVLQNVLGKGAMGKVYLALDPELNRRVAVKTLHETAGDLRSEERRSRLIRESLALARINAPNVAAIYDVGDCDGGVFVAMEYVEGGTLREWLSEAPRGWREVVEVFLQAGEGLVAAHRAGIIHRDFKPTNVLVGCDGRVRVADFGLARLGSLDMREPSSSQSVEVDVRSTLTGMGTVVGTPLYMAPEQFFGDAIDDRADQFSFCSTLFQSLYGAPPFEGRDPVELVGNISAGRLAVKPSGRVPRWLRRIVLKGLSAAPHDRWSSMQRLLAALRRGLTRGRSRVGWTIAATSVAAGAVAMNWPISLPAQCAATGLASMGSRELPHIRQNLATSRHGGADRPVASVERWLQARVDAWTITRDELCDREPAESVHIGQWVCLDDSHRQIRAAIEVLAAIEQPRVLEAISLVADLPDPEQCLDPGRNRLRPVPPSEPGVRESIEDLRFELARAEVLRHMGSYAAADRVLAEVSLRSVAIDFPALSIGITLERGRLALARGLHDEAERLLEDAHHAGVAIADHDLAATSAVEMVCLVARDFGSIDRSQFWERQANALFPTTFSGGRLAAGLEICAGQVDLRHGEFERAAEHYARGCSRIEENFGEGHPNAASCHSALGDVYYRRGRYDDALDHQLAALKIREESLGRTHPQTATTLGSIALIHRDAGEYERARALFDEAVHIHRSVLGDRHQRVAMSLANAATAYARLERASEAKAMQLEALAILEDAVGTDHPLVATVRTDLVATCTLLGEYSQALEHGDRALAILSSLGERHPDRAEALVNLGMVYRGMGKMERAGAHFEQALEIIAEHYGEEHPRAVEVRRLLAELDDEGEPSRG